LADQSVSLELGGQSRSIYKQIAIAAYKNTQQKAFVAVFLVIIINYLVYMGFVIVLVQIAGVEVQGGDFWVPHNSAPIKPNIYGCWNPVA